MIYALAIPAIITVVLVVLMEWLIRCKKCTGWYIRPEYRGNIMPPPVPRRKK